MSYKELLERVRGEVKYSDLISIFLSNFRDIHNVGDLEPDLRSRLADISDTPEKVLMRKAEGSYPGLTTRSFIFREDNTFSGILDLDFIHASLANVRIQLFAVGFRSSTKMKKRYQEILGFAQRRFGDAEQDTAFDRLVWKSGNLIITLRKPPRSLGTNPNISFTLTDKRYA